MSFSVGIIGLPNVGKSTLFKALTKKRVDIADYPFTTIDPNIGIVTVPDKRLKQIASIIQPEKTIETVIKFVDIAGIVKDAHKGEGMGNQFLSHIRPCDAVIEVVKTFGDSNPKEDIEIIKNELSMKDLETNDNVLCSKPKIYLFNIKKEVGLPQIPNSFAIDLKLEEEASELSSDEKKELNIEPKLDELILACYNILNLITFFTTTGKKEVRAWTIKKGSDVITAAAKVHTDFAEKFIKAKITPWQKLSETDSHAIVGKEYIVQDGDIIEFKI